MLAAHEKIDLGGVDEVAGVAKWWCGAVGPGGEVSVPLGDGRVMTGVLAPDWSGGSERRLRGRTIDLRTAYKQWARSPATSAFGVVVVLNPATGEREARVCKAMCFGDKGAVWQCNRVFRAQEWLLHRLVWVVATNYVDDYPLVEPEATAEGSVAAFEELAALLG